VVVQGVLVTAVTYTNVTRKRQSQHRQVADFLLSLMLHMTRLKENPRNRALLKCDNVISARVLQTLQLSILLLDPIIINAHPQSAPHKG